MLGDEESHNVTAAVTPQEAPVGSAAWEADCRRLGRWLGIGLLAVLLYSAALMGWVGWRLHQVNNQTAERMQ